MSERRYTLQAQMACVAQELFFRRHAYPVRVMARRMTAEQADHQIACMQAVHDTLADLARRNEKPSP